MSKGPDETTDKLFPPPESGVAERPLPLAPSLRTEFLAYRLHFDKELKALHAKVDQALANLPQAVPSTSVLGSVKNGALVTLRYGGVALAVGELAAQIAKAAGHPEIEGPIRAFSQFFGAQ